MKETRWCTTNPKIPRKCQITTFYTLFANTMATKSKVLEVSEAKEVTTNYWTSYKFALLLENGEKWWTTLLKTSNPPCKVWEEIEYDIEEKNGFKSIKLASQAKQFWLWQAKRDYAKDWVWFAMSYAKDLVVAWIVPLENLTTQADIIYEWINKKYW